MATYTPFSELGQTDTGVVRWHLQLPDYAPSDHIGINTAMVERIARWGGIGRLHIVTFDGDVTRTRLEADGIDPDGTTTAANKLTIDKAHLSDADISYHDDTAAIGEVKLNITEVTDQLSTQKANALRDAKAWAKIVDHSLGNGVQQAVKSNLVTKLGLTQLAATEAIWGAIDFGFHADNPAEGAGVLMATHGIMLLLNKFRNRDAMPSFFPGVRLDHLAAAKAIGATMRYAKAL